MEGVKLADENKESESKIIEKIKSIKPEFLKLEYDKDTFRKDYNYILTNKAEERLNKLYTYISKGISVLLEGETGSSKTLSAEIICRHIYDEKKNNNLEKDNDEQVEEMYIKYNLSNETTINDLMQKFIGDKNSISGLKIVDGPFYKAFKYGLPLILDEINLATEEVLQCLEDTLDSGSINIDISGIGLVTQKKKEGFCLIATQNPNKDNYINKRQNLSHSFLSHFQVIKFPSFDIEELKKIANDLFISFNNGEKGDENDNNFLNDLIDFHKSWTSKEERKKELACFTIREIAATVKAYIDEKKKNPYKIVKVIYASRYPKDKKEELLKLLREKNTFKNDYKNYALSKLPEGIKGFYDNNAFKEVIESSLFSLEKGRNILISGVAGSGKTSVARAISKYLNNKAFKENNKETNYFHFICTEETKCSDLIGYNAPKSEDNLNKLDKSIIEWKEGFLTKSIKEGNIVILDNLQEASSTVTERLNCLLDFKYDENTNKGSKKKFDIPENPLESSILIHDNFRIIGVCDSK